MKESRLAQRKLGKNQNTNNLKKKKGHKAIIALFIFLFVVIISFLGILILNSSWDGRQKISVAVQKEGGDVEVIIIDPASSSITNLEIPKETEVQAANNLGTWKLGSITRLGNDKKLDGSFLKNTIIESLNLPIDDWANEKFLSLVSGNLFQSIDPIFTTDSNLTISDKIRIVLFSLGIGTGDRANINLKNSDYLQRVQLTDGTLGWQAVGNLPTSIESYFIEGQANQAMNVLINNGSGNNGITSVFANTITGLGLNIASIQNIATINSDCLIIGTDKEIVTKIADIFSCSKKYSEPSNNFSIEVDLGTKTKNRF